MDRTVPAERAEDDSVEVHVEENIVRPKPRIGLLGAVAFGVGSIIGSGIFVAPKGALQNTESIGMSLVMWVISGGISTVIGLVYAELGTLVHKSGGDYIYINEGIGSLPAFLTAWIQPVFALPAGHAVLALVFADYLCAPIFGTCTPPDSIRKVIAATMILTIGITNIISVKFAASTQIFFTVTKLLALVIIIVGGVVFLAQGRTENFNNAFQRSSTDVTSYSLAIYSCMFAYGGSQHINEITEELIDPKRNIPRATIISIASTTLIYLFTNISYFVLLSKSEFLASSAVAYDWGLQGISPAAVIIPISVMCSVYGTSNGNCFSVGRVIFSAAREGHLPDVMSYLHMRTSIPVVAIILPQTFALIMLIPADISMLINMTIFFMFVIVLLTTISLIRIKYRSQFEKRKPISGGSFTIPALNVLICVFMIVSPFISADPPAELLYSAGLLVSGIILYIPFVHFKLKVPGMDRVTTSVQLLLQVCPTEKTT